MFVSYTRSCISFDFVNAFRGVAWTEFIEKGPENIARNVEAHIKAELVDVAEDKTPPETNLKRSVNALQSKTRNVAILSHNLCGLHSKRKEHLDNMNRLNVKIRQNQLTYADMQRKKNNLEEGLRRVENQLKADELQRMRENESIEHTIEQMEQLARELRDLCLEPEAQTVSRLKNQM